MAKVKICGITNLEDAKAATAAGADALGFIFYKKSPRYITPEKVKEIISVLPGKIAKIGVFVGAEEKEIRRIAKMCRLDMLQFHGGESPGFCRRFRGKKIIKAFRIKDSVSLKNILKYRTAACLFDTFAASKAGGTGRRFNWELIKDIRKKIKRPLFLSGGLNIGNIKEAIRTVRPAWLDVSSSVESSPGKKNHIKLREFIKTAKK